jgi:hypothetical protein
LAAKKAEQDALRAKQEKERRLAAERAKQVEIEKKMAADAMKAKVIADRKAALDSYRSKATATVPKRQPAVTVDTETSEPLSPAKASPKPKTSPKPVTPLARGGSVIDEEKKAAARARIEAERREQQEKESKSDCFYYKRIRC